LFVTGAASAQAGLNGGQSGLSQEGQRTEKRVTSRQGVVRTRGGRVLSVGARSTYLKEGLSIAEVVWFLGQPISASEWREGDTRLSTYVFNGAGTRVLVAEFTNGLLVRSQSSTRDELAKAKHAGQ
jgi:hypothetical protein